MGLERPNPCSPALSRASLTSDGGLRKPRHDPARHDPPPGGALRRSRLARLSQCPLAFGQGGRPRRTKTVWRGIMAT
eukprot:2061190-Pyramimonas_sp.AAC.1